MYDQNGLRVFILVWGSELADQVSSLQLDLYIHRLGLDPCIHTLLVPFHGEDSNGNLEDQPSDFQVKGLKQHKVRVLRQRDDLGQGALIF